MYKSSYFFMLLFFVGFQTVSVFAENLEKDSESSKQNFEIDMDEIIVSTPMKDRISSSAKPVNILKTKELRLKASSTIGETLQYEMGVHGQSFGPAVGLPVIRGQDGPRVRVLNNGLGTNDSSQNSPDHASTAIPLTAERIEILRGPATLLYGSGAIGGVVNVIDNRIPEKVPDQLVGGSLEQKYNSVSNNRSTAVKIEGGKNKFAYHFDGYYQKNDDIKISGDAIDAARAQVSQNGLVVVDNSNGFIDNTSADNLSGTAGFSFVGDSGFFGFSGNVLDMEYQVPPNGTAGGEKIFIELEQRKLDFKSEWNNPVGFIETVRTKLSFTDYEHSESLKGFFRNDTFEGRVEAPHKGILGVKGIAGFQIMTSRFSALDIPTGTYLNPITRTNSYSAFVQESFDVGATVAQLGLRIEHTILNSELRANPNPGFTPISVSVSDLWNIDDQSSINLAFTRSQRAPMVQELFFSGGHDATASFEKGNPNLKIETSYNIDLGYKFNLKKVVAEINLFHNWANDYIFRQRTGATVNGDPEVIYQQATATFMGYEAQFIFHVWKNTSEDVDLTLFSDYTRAQLNNEGDVPRIPPLRWGFQLDHLYGNWSSNLRLTRAEKQEYSGVNEASTPGYTLLNLNTHYHIEKFNKADLVVYAKGNNLLNENIRNSASFLRNFSPEPGIGGEIGIRINY